jgi:MFS family permease
VGVERTPSGLAKERDTTGGAPAAKVGRGFVVLYALAYTSTSLVLITPLLVTLALKVNSLVGTQRAPNHLSLITGVGALVAMVGNPLCGRMSDRTVSPLGMRRPWMLAGLAGGTLGIVGVALAPRTFVVLVSWCVAQLSFNALLAAQAAVLPDQVPVSQRGSVAGVLGVAVPVASVTGTYLVDLFEGNVLLMFLAPCVVGGIFIVLFAVVMRDRRLPVAQRPPWSLGELARTFYVAPRGNPDFAWAFASRFLFVLAYAFLITYQAYYLIEELGRSEGDVPELIFIGVSVQSAFVVLASLTGGFLSDRLGRRKVFVIAAAAVYALALFVLAVSGGTPGYLFGMALGGLGFGIYIAVDLALVADVLPSHQEVAKDLGVLNIAGALPFSIAPALAPVILIASDGSYAVLYGVAAVAALAAAAAIIPVRRVR